jgi:hypothetical protein
MVWLEARKFEDPMPFSSRPSANFTRPADTTAYASGDLVANSTTAGSVAPLQFAAKRPGASQRILSATLHKSGTGIVTAAFRLHLFSSSPGVANGDNGAFVPSLLTGYLGAIDITVDLAGTVGAVGQGVPRTGIATSILTIASATGVIFGLLEARGAYTPASAEVFTVTLDVAPETAL